MDQAASELREVSSNRFGDHTTIHQGNIGAVHYHLPRRPSPAAVVRAIPYPRNEDIVDRPDVIDSLNKLLPSVDTEYSAAALYGLGGSGKTQIALDYAYRRCRDVSCSVFWVHADSEATFIHDYQDIARCLGISVNLEQGDLLRAVRSCIEAQEKWVLILDNADDLLLFGVAQGGQNNQPNSLFNHIPRAASGTVLWTSRDERIVGTLVGSRRGIRVGPMTPPESTKLLEIARNMEIHEDSTEAVALAQELQQLPLAISQAGAYMRRTSTPIRMYLTMLRKGKQRWKILKETETDRHRRPLVSNSILETWTISMELIQQESPMAYRMLNVIAYLDHRNIPVELLTAAAQDDGKDQEEEPMDLDVIQAITRLKEFSFLSIADTRNGKQRYEMHKLVQEATQYKLSMDLMSERDAQKNDYNDYNPMRGELYYCRIAIQIMLRAFPISERETWEQCDEYLVHVIGVGEWAEAGGKQIEVAEPFSRVSKFLYDRGRWREKEPVDKKALALRREVLGEKHPDTIGSMAELATTYHQQGHYSKAESMKADVLELRREVLGEKHPDTIGSMAELAATYHAQGRYDEDEDISVKVLDLRRQVLGEKHPDTLQAMHDLAVTWNSRGRREDALSLMDQCLQWQQSILGSDHPLTIRSVKVLAEWQERSKHKTKGFAKRPLALFKPSGKQRF
ncbi:P-loop containing nucleoside triphosphate hydrolase protein [Stachybotrys elegans]|uniref:P-loop containing nucleoside triphosphate hydrolase protein n=1 Tax=Stachybotrys elegans TaxID=80388 RepID=A0A8K0SKN7_9HYPO|nr:P-loop containing nucleoside triphosphate hydrolase protein [Stachybotrys elegans]